MSISLIVTCDGCGLSVVRVPGRIATKTVEPDWTTPRLVQEVHEAQERTMIYRVHIYDGKTVEVDRKTGFAIEFDQEVDAAGYLSRTGPGP